jgi:hypothetical protein
MDLITQEQVDMWEAKILENTKPYLTLQPKPSNFNFPDLSMLEEDLKTNYKSNLTSEELSSIKSN